MTLPDLTAGVILVSLITYALLGGADFGGGVWDLLARGPRARAQRATVARAIGPIWEANHVWMIVAVVLLFSAFPPAFAVIMTALHVPVTILLIGIVLRGSAFVFRKYDPGAEGDEGAPSRWGHVFAASSVLAPLMLGVVLGTLSTTAIGVEDGVVTGGFFAPWLRPFPWAVGAFALALFAFLAAVYLTLEPDDPALSDDFRARGLGAAAAVLVTGAVAALLAPSAAPTLAEGLTGARGLTLMVLGAGALLMAAGALWRRRYALARVAAGATVTLVLLDWGLAQYPWLVAETISIEEAAAPDVTLQLILWVLAGGAVILVPAFLYLYRTFKGGTVFRSLGPPR